MWGSVSTAPPDYFIVLPPVGHGNGWRTPAWYQFGFAETRCAPEQYALHNQAHLMSSAAAGGSRSAGAPSGHVRDVRRNGRDSALDRRRARTDPTPDGSVL